MSDCHDKRSHPLLPRTGERALFHSQRPFAARDSVHESPRLRPSLARRRIRANRAAGSLPKSLPSLLQFAFRRENAKSVSRVIFLNRCNRARWDEGGRRRKHVSNIPITLQVTDQFQMGFGFLNCPISNLDFGEGVYLDRLGGRPQSCNSRGQFGKFF